MEIDIEESQANKPTDMEGSGNMAQANDKTIRTAKTTKKKICENILDNFSEQTEANVNGDHSAHMKISSTAIKNKNAGLRKSKSYLEMTKMNEGSLPHSKSFSGNYSTQMSIPECDGNNSNQKGLCNISVRNRKDNITNTDNDNWGIHTSDSFSNLQLFGNKQKTSHQLKQDRKPQYNHQNKLQQHQQKQQQQSRQNAEQKMSKQHSSQQELQQHHHQIFQQNLLQEEQTQQVSNDPQMVQNHKDSQQLQAYIKMAVTSTATAAVSTDSIITSTTSTTSKAIATTSIAIASTSKTTSTTPGAIATSAAIAISTAIATTSIATSFTSKAIAKTSTAIAISTVAVTLQKQLPPSPPPHLKLSKNSLEPTLASHALFSPPTLKRINYATWLPKLWQDRKVEQFHDDQPSLNLPETEETTDISTEETPTDHGLSHGKQAQTKTVVCKTPSTMSRSRSVPCSNQSQPLSTSLSAPAGTTDFKGSTPQKTTPTSTLNDLGSNRISVHGELSVIENSPVSSASLVYADYASVPHSSSSTQISSMPSWTTMSSHSSMTSIESPTLSTKSSSSSISSLPTAKVSPMASSTGSISTKEKRTDFILLSAIADQEKAEMYRAHLKIDIGIPDLTIDLFSEIDSGRTAMMSLETLHERYNNILVLCTINLEGDSYSRFLHENVLTTGLQDAHGKEDRVIPVWTSHDCKRKISEFRCITGFQYYNFLSDKTSALACGYVKTVKNAVNDGRKKCR